MDLRHYEQWFREDAGIRRSHRTDELESLLPIEVRVEARKQYVRCGLKYKTICAVAPVLLFSLMGLDEISRYITFSSIGLIFGSLITQELGPIEVTQKNRFDKINEKDGLRTTYTRGYNHCVKEWLGLARPSIFNRIK